VKRVLAVGLFVAGFAAAGAFSGAVIADTGTTTGTTAETTTAPSTTTVVTTTTTSVSGTVPDGVRIAGVRVGGLERADAASAVQQAFEQPLPVVIDRDRLELDPASVATAYVATAVARARIAAPRSNVQLAVSVNGPALRAWLAKATHRYARLASDATLTLRRGRPALTPDTTGRTLDTKRLYARIVTALRANSRLPLRTRTRAVPAAVTAKSFGPVILINRSINRLFLYRNTGRSLQPWRVFSVATGQSIYPTPAGTFHIVVKWVNPWWYPPTQDAWAKGLKPVPPGPSNPLGTRWMGLSAPGVGIHGTDEPASIGYSASHGCIRMQVPDAEWLFGKVRVGTMVFIV
jgi:lipoprotein-anchoring transpeptidase ErfK/SrfK